MGRIRVSTRIAAPPNEVWDALEDVGSHIDWMADAEAIRFRTKRRQGTGTVFECDTKVGPLRLTDVMEITEWVPRRAMGVRHVGLVTGTGRFTLKSSRGGGTRFTWAEKLSFPWWLGGPVGSVIGGEVLRFVWKANLRRLRHIIESP